MKIAIFLLVLCGSSLGHAFLCGLLCEDPIADLRSFADGIGAWGNAVVSDVNASLVDVGRLLNYLDQRVSRLERRLNLTTPPCEGCEDLVVPEPLHDLSPKDFDPSKPRSRRSALFPLLARTIRERRLKRTRLQNSTGPIFAIGGLLSSGNHSAREVARISDKALSDKNLNETLLIGQVVEEPLQRSGPPHMANRVLNELISPAQQRIVQLKEKVRSHLERAAQLIRAPSSKFNPSKVVFYLEELIHAGEYSPGELTRSLDAAMSHDYSAGVSTATDVMRDYLVSLRGHGLVRKPRALGNSAASGYQSFQKVVGSIPALISGIQGGVEQHKEQVVGSTMESVFPGSKFSREQLSQASAGQLQTWDLEKSLFVNRTIDILDLSPTRINATEVVDAVIDFVYSGEYSPRVIAQAVYKLASCNCTNRTTPIRQVMIPFLELESREEKRTIGILGSLIRDITDGLFLHFPPQYARGLGDLSTRYPVSRSTLFPSIAPVLQQVSKIVNELPFNEEGFRTLGRLSVAMIQSVVDLAEHISTTRH